MRAFLFRIDVRPFQMQSQQGGMWIVLNGMNGIAINGYRVGGKRNKKTCCTRLHDRTGYGLQGFCRWLCGEEITAGSVTLQLNQSWCYDGAFAFNDDCISG